MTIREINIDEHWERALPLMHAHWSEAGFDWAFSFDPSRNRYKAMQDAGICFALGAFVDEQLVGYCSAVLSGHAFNPALLMCISDAIYLLPMYRGSFLAGRLILATEHAAKTRGATVIAWHTRSGTHQAAMLESHGYLGADAIVMKGLHHERSH